MPKPPFRLIKKKFSEVDNEWQWTYQYSSTIIFNNKEINKITITDHYQQSHPEVTNKLILKLLVKKLNTKTIKALPESYLWKWDVFRFDTSYDEQPYRLIFWFKDGTVDHLWIRNCHPID